MWHHNRHLINAYQQILRWNINWFCCFSKIKLIKIALYCGVISFSHVLSSFHLSTDSVAEGRYPNNPINTNTHNYEKSSHVSDACWESCLGSENKRRERIWQRLVHVPGEIDGKRLQIFVIDNCKLSPQINTDPMKNQVGYLNVVGECIHFKINFLLSRSFVCSVPPDILDYPTSTDMVVREGSNVTLKCAARGSPTPNITWRREGSEPIVISGQREGGGK